jgi:hypothetical protein
MPSSILVLKGETAGMPLWEVFAGTSEVVRVLAKSWDWCKLDPAGAAETNEEVGADRDDHRDHGEIAIAPLELRHVREVHPVDARDRSRYGEDCSPAGEPPACLALPGRLKQQARFKGEAQHLAQRVDLLEHAVHVVNDVSVIGPEGGINAREIDMLEPSADLSRRCHHQAQLLQLPPKPVNPGDLGLVQRRGQDVLLQRLDLLG